MSGDRKSPLDGNLVKVVFPLLVILAPLGLSVIGAVSAGDPGAEEPFLELPPEPNEGCVRDAEFMRFHHWELLREVRDQVVRGGGRHEISLDRCRSCHPSRERFCSRCHEAVSLQPDCFGCHYYPADPAAAVDHARAGR
ncbi:MAG: hypothetical protein GY838_09715 [bacterium]|nr:hypothetical protein [bacterium]